MTDRPCAVVACPGTGVDPAHALNVAPAAGLPHPVSLCPDHWQQVEGSLGDELRARRFVVAPDDGVGWRRGGFNPGLDPDRNFGILHVEGRVYGSDDPARLGLVLTPDVVRALRSLVRLYDAQQVR